MIVESQYDLHKIPVGSLITYRNKYEDTYVSGNLLEILPNTGQYKLNRDSFIWTHYIQWDKFEYSYEVVNDYVPPPPLSSLSSASIDSTPTKNQIRNQKKKKKRKKKKAKQKVKENTNGETTITVSSSSKSSDKTITSFENQEGDLVVKFE